MIQDPPILATIEKCKQYASILKMKMLIRIENCFHFEHIDDKKMAVVVKNLNAEEVKQEHDIRIKLIKENIDLFSFFCLKC